MSKINLDGARGIFGRKTSTKAVKSFKPNASNPFGISFKGKVINADIFETKAKTSTIDKISKKGKLLASAAVGSLTKLKSAATQKLQPVIDFGQKISAHVGEFINKVNQLELTQFSVALQPKNKTNHTNKKVEELKKRPIEDLKTMLQNQIEADKLAA